MAWVDGTTKSTGDVITAAIWNSFMGSGGNMDLTAPGVVTTAGDIVYATADNTLARLAIGGTEGHVLSVSSGSIPEWAASGGGSWTLETANTTEYTTSSTSNATLVTISGLSVSASKPVVIGTRWHSTTGAGAFRSGGVLQVNGGDYSTSLKDVGDDSYSEVNQCWKMEYINPREADYNSGGWSFAGGSYGTGGGLFHFENGLPSNAGNAAWDTETLSSFSIGGRVGNAGITLKLKGVYLWSVAIS